MREMMWTLVALCLGCAAAVAAPETRAGVEIYVAAGGSDANPGTKARPLATLAGARGAVRRLKAGKGIPEGGIRVLLTGGTYRLKETFALDERDSGQEGRPVVYAAAPGEEVRLSGGIAVPAGAPEPVTDAAVLKRLPEDARGRALQVDLKALGITDTGVLGPRGFRRPYIPAPLELFVDDKPMQIARWPNEGTVPIGQVLDTGSVPRNGDFSDRGGTFRYTDDRHARWAGAEDLWLSGLWNYGYADDTLRVASIDPQTKTVTLAQATMYGIASGRAWQEYYALNLLEEIDAPGEYYVDGKSGTLTFCPPATYAPGKSRLCVSVLQEPMVALEGASHVRFERLTFECSRGMGVYIERGSGNLIAGCTLRNLGIVAVCIGKGTEPLKEYAHAGTAPAASRMLGSWHEHIYDNTTFNREAGTGHGVVGCDIYDIGAGGISLGGGDRKTLTPAGNLVRNCHIHHVNRLDRTYKAPVNIDGVGNRIEHCLIHDCPNNAVYLHGNDHVVELNEIHHAVQLADDMGVIYLGRDPSEYGNVIRHNFLHHNGSEAGATGVLYFDDASTGVTVFGNVFYENRGGNWINGGYDHRFENNLFVDDVAAVRDGWPPKRWHDYMKSPELNKRLRVDLDIARPPYSEKYPQLLRLYQADPADDAAHGQDVVRNVSVRSGDFGGGRNRLKENLVLDADPGFADLAAMDFTLRPDSVVFQRLPGFQPIPFGRIGLYVGDYRKTLPFEVPGIDGPEEFLQSATVTIPRPRRSAGVVYTLDGTEPTLRSPRYTEPITLTRTTVVSARAVGQGNPPALSEVVRREVRLIRPKLPRTAQVNFQPADGRLVEGWLADTGTSFRMRPDGLAFGWTRENGSATRRRGKNPDPLVDTLIHFSPDTRWEMAVENGAYEVTVCLGDSEYACEGQTLFAEGKELCKGLNLKANEPREVKARVTVEDGMLTLSSNDAPHGPRLTRMLWLRLERVD